MSLFPDHCVESCDARPKIVCEENKRTYIANNTQRKVVCKVQVDGKLICEGARCDWAVAVVSEEGTGKALEELFLVELKGSDINHAFEQIVGTIDVLHTNYSVTKWFARVVCAKVSTPQLNSIHYKKLKRRLQLLNKSTGKTQRQLIIVKSNQLQEVL